jgi:hypothetical protein
MGRKPGIGFGLAALLLLSLLPCRAAPGSAEDLCHNGGVTVYPTAPTTADMVSLVVSGWWGSSCPAVQCEHDLADYHITLSITVTDLAAIPPVACLDVVTPWTITHELGALLPGEYTVQANCSAGACWSFQEKATFQVRQALGPQRVYLPAVRGSGAGPW